MKLRKKRADISILVAVFCVAFLAFCAFGIDMAYVTLNRMKLQRSTETTALASVARYKSVKADESENLFQLYKSRFDTLQDAKIVSANYKEEADGVYKLALFTELMSPTYFLRFAGVGGIKIEAKSYAQTYEQDIKDKDFGEVLSLESLMTDKKGNEFEVKTSPESNGYFIFAGTKNQNGAYLWADIGCKADVQVSTKNIQGKNYTLICSNEAKFDLSRTCLDNTNINVVQYIKIYGANQGDCGGAEVSKDIEELIKQKLKESSDSSDAKWIEKFPLKDKEGKDIPWDKLVMPEIPDYPITLQWLEALLPAPPSNPYSIKILNNVKLITSDDF